MKSRILYDAPSKTKIISFRRRIMSWFDEHGRAFPWRETDNPFKLLVAEMMLRRTKADQVKLVYDRLFQRYPDVDAIAEAPIEDLENILYPLGLRWRTPAFQLIAREIKEKYVAKVPKTREELRTLPGVGEYVAGAVLSIAYGKKEWIVDSNIVRLFKRYFGVETSKEGRRDPSIIGIAKLYASGKDPRTANLAILDFAALICTARNPHHDICPLKNKCKYSWTGRQGINILI